MKISHILTKIFTKQETVEGCFRANLRSKLPSPSQTRKRKNKIHEKEHIFCFIADCSPPKREDVDATNFDTPNSAVFWKLSCAEKNLKAFCREKQHFQPKM